MTEKKSLADLIAILTIKKKSELRLHCRNATIFNDDFANLIFACMAGELPWAHQRHHREFQPKHLELTSDDVTAISPLGGPRAKKAMNKVSALFNERRLLSGHLFFKRDLSEWHLFYFDQRDFSTTNNHWDGGSHIHIINHLWPNRGAQEAWDQFRTGNPQMKGALHIRFMRNVGEVH